VRPSGTEPKLKTYLEVVAADRPEADEQLSRLRGELTEAIGS
jgi:phosphomannomutase